MGIRLNQDSCNKYSDQTTRLSDYSMHSTEDFRYHRLYIVTELSEKKRSLTATTTRNHLIYSDDLE